MSKIQKPNWTPIELNEKCERHNRLIDQTIDHDHDCQCNSCMELFGLRKLIGKFSRDEIANAVIEANKIHKNMVEVSEDILKEIRSTLKFILDNTRESSSMHSRLETQDVPFDKKQLQRIEQLTEVIRKIS